MSVWVKMLHNIVSEGYFFFLSSATNWNRNEVKLSTFLFVQVTICDYNSYVCYIIIDLSSACYIYCDEIAAKN